MEQQTEHGEAGAVDRDTRLDALEQRLIERIADVDDDRRRTASALHRALETRVEEMDAMLRRSRRMTAIFAAAALLVALAAIGMVLNRPTIDLSAMTGKLAQLEQDVARMRAVSSEDDLLREKLSGLTALVTDISSALEMFERERSERQAADARLEARLAQSEASRDRVADEIEAPSEALADTLPSSGVVSEGEPLRSAQASAQPGGDIAQTSHSPAMPSESLTEQPSGQTTVTPTPQDTVLDDETGLAGTMPSATEQAASFDQQEDASSNPDASGLAASDTPTAEFEAAKPDQDTGRRQAWSIEESSLSLDEQRYALQLIGFYSLDALREFADRDDLPNRLYYRRERLRGRPWYVLIHSLHPNTTSVAAARATLPPDLADLDIWVRSLSEGTRLEVFEFVVSDP